MSQPSVPDRNERESSALGRTGFGSSALGPTSLGRALAEPSGALGGPAPFPQDAYSDVLASNDAYAKSFTGGGLSGRAARGLAIVTCMDSRIDPLAVVGMKPGDAKILRNAGARVTGDVLRTLVLAAYLLDVTRVLVMPHTRCKMASGTSAEIHEHILKTYGVDTYSLEFHTVSDQEGSLRHDLRRIRSYPLLPRDLMVAGALYDVDSGRLQPIDG